MNPTGVLETAKKTNPLKDLLKFGQSVWLDYIRRDLLTSGELKRLIDEDGLRGMTSNPAIFEKAIAGGKLYDDLLNSLRSRTDLDAKGRFEILAIRDIQDAADILRPVYDSTKRRDGYVSIEVSPYLAHDTKGSLEEARRLWKSVGRENVMVKIPGTPGRLACDSAGPQRRPASARATGPSATAASSQATRRSDPASTCVDSWASAKSSTGMPAGVNRKLSRDCRRASSVT